MEQRYMLSEALMPTGMAYCDVSEHRIMVIDVRDTRLVFFVDGKIVKYGDYRNQYSEYDPKSCVWAPLHD